MAANGFLSSIRRPLHLLLAVSFVCAQLPAFSLGQPAAVESPENIEQRWNRIYTLRSSGEYDRAIESLHQIILEFSDSEEVLRQAYKDLIFTFKSKGDVDGSIEIARQGLTKFPDLKPDRFLFTSFTVNVCDSLRAEMFGSLRIKKPDGCQVFLDGDHVGEAPLIMEYVPIGEHDLRAIQSGRREYREPVVILPNQRVELELSLDQAKGTRWWLTRIGAGLAVGTLVAVSMAGSDEIAEEPIDPLVDPPMPPGYDGGGR